MIVLALIVLQVLTIMVIEMVDGGTIDVHVCTLTDHTIASTEYISMVSGI